jgi:carbon storage regulator CsrA
MRLGESLGNNISRDKSRVHRLKTGQILAKIDRNRDVFSRFLNVARRLHPTIFPVAPRGRVARIATTFRTGRIRRYPMLVLSRKVGERIHVGNDIVLEVRKISGNRVTIAVEAPRDVRILRGELELAAREFGSDEDEVATCENARNAAPSSPISPTNRLTMLGVFPAHHVAADFSV